MLIITHLLPCGRGRWSYPANNGNRFLNARQFVRLLIRQIIRLTPSYLAGAKRQAEFRSRFAPQVGCRSQNHRQHHSSTRCALWQVLQALVRFLKAAWAALASLASPASRTLALHLRKVSAAPFHTLSGQRPSSITT